VGNWSEVDQEGGRAEADAKNGEWLLYLQDQTAEGLGYHTVKYDESGKYQIVGYVSGGAGFSGWTVTASHELLEMLGDSLVDQAENGVMREVGDPVENSSYRATSDPNSVLLSDFVFPSWFGDNAGPQDKFDFLGKAHGPLQLGDEGGYTIAASQAGVSINSVAFGAKMLPPSILRGAVGGEFGFNILAPYLRKYVKGWKARRDAAPAGPGRDDFKIADNLTATRARQHIEAFSKQ